MIYPMLTPLAQHREVTDSFAGYNHNLRNYKGQWYDMENMTSKFAPLLAPRQQRGTYKEVDDPQGLIAKGALVYVDGSKVVVDGYEVEMNLSTAPEDCPKALVGMGANVIIMPDKKYINTIDVADRGDIEAYFASTGEVSFQLCNITGADITATNSPTAPESPKNGDYWIDTSGENHVLKRYSEATKVWVAFPTSYVKISATGIGKNFKRDDGVEISGVLGEDLKDLNASMVIWEKADDYIVVIGLPDQTHTQTEPIKVERRMPKMDFITESKNRLWGCRYGANNKGEIVNEIYASKAGDFKNWQYFPYTASDSYIASIGSDGPFTAAVTHKGHPVFYKENVKHKVFGDYPATFGVVTAECRGVGLGNHNSCAIVNDNLYYMSANSICKDDGSLPIEISQPMGEIRYRNGSGGSYGSKYYLSMQDEDDKWHLFVLDTQKGMWHREDSTHAMDIYAYHNDVYFIEPETKKIRTMFGSGTKDTQPVHWMVESGLMGTSSPDTKYVSQLQVRMSADIGTRVRFFAQYDSIGQWEFLCNMAGTTLRTFTAPVRLRRCDHFRIRIEGEGDMRIHSITKTIEEGS